MGPPLTRWLAGCLVGFLLLLGVGLLVRPFIFTLAPPRDDSVVMVAPLAAVAAGPIEVPVVLSRSRGLDGEIDAGSGRAQINLIVSQVETGGYAVVNAASPVEADCPVVIADGELRDCADRRWSTDGRPADASYPPLQSFPTRVESGAIVADLTRTMEPGA